MKPEISDVSAYENGWKHRAYLILLTCLLIPLLGGAARFSETRTQENGAIEIRNPSVRVSGKSAERTLPCNIRGLSPGTPVSVSFTAGPEQGDALFLHPVYSPLDVYVNDTLVCSFGKEGSYPSFFTDPPTGAFSVPLPHTGAARDIRLEYRSPAARNSISLYAPVIGSEADILGFLSAKYALTLILSVCFILMGLLLLIGSLLFLRFERRGKLLRYPGALAFCGGLWQFGENTLSVYLTRLPSLMYLMAFIGLFAIALPLYRQTMMILSLQKSRLLRFFLSLLEVSVVVAAALQLFGLVPFSRSLYWFHFLLPLSVCVLAGRVLLEAVRTRSGFAIGFFLATLAIAVGALLELLNYYFRFSSITSLFQLCLALFTLICAVLSFGYMSRIFMATQRNVEMQREIDILERSIDAQKEKNNLLLEHEEEVRRQRHDLRQHLNVILSALEAGRYEEINAYVRELTERIPVNRDVTWCDHPVANALLSYYVSSAEAENVQCEVRAQIPAHLPHVSDGDLCVLIGNLLENAVEACQRMTEGQKKLAFRARVQGELLTVTVDNAYDGKVRFYRGKYLSSKRDAPGTGLQSVISVARRHGGEAVFESGGTTFRSNVYIRI